MSLWKVCVFLSVKSLNIFPTVCTKIIKTIAHNTKRRRPRFQKIKSCFFLSIRFRKTFQTQDVKSLSTKRSVRKLAQPKRTLHLNKKHVLLQVKRSEEVLKTAFLVTTKATSPPELKKTFLEPTQRRFEKFLFCSRNKSCFLSIRYHKTSQTQDVKRQITEPSLQKLAQPKRDSAFEQKTRIVPSRETSGSSQNIFFTYNQRKKQSRAQTDILERTQRHFGKLVFSFR